MFKTRLLLDLYGVLQKELERIREESEKDKDLKKAIENAVLYCKNANILIDFLKEHGGDVVDMLYARLTDKQINKINWKDGYEDGIERGENKKALDVAMRMRQKEIDVAIISDVTGVPIIEVERL